jgi:hypothetical protein
MIDSEFYSILGWCMLGSMAYICISVGLREAIRDARHRAMKRSLRTPPEIQAWLTDWVENGGKLG